MKPYTMWKMDDTRWLLEVEDEVLGEHIKELSVVENPIVDRFGVGINTPLRVYSVKEENVASVEKIIETWLRRKKHG
jgi:hypothetical protein